MKNFFFRWVLIWLWFTFTILIFLVSYWVWNWLTHVNFGDSLTHTKWNEIVDSINTIWSKVDTINNVPVWTILAWHKNMTWVPSLPDWWVECNWQVINDSNSPLNWANTPNLNNQVYAWGKWYYLRWGNVSWQFNPSSAWDDNGSAYTTSFWTRYWSATAAFRDLENSTFRNSYNSSVLNPNDYRFQVAAMTVVYIIKIK